MSGGRGRATIFAVARNVFFCCALFWLCSLAAWGEPLTLDASVARVLGTHPVLADYRARVVQAEAQVDLAWVPGRPTLAVSGNYTNQNPVLISTAGIGSQTYNNGIGNLLLTQTLATFGRLHYAVAAAELNRESLREQLRFQEDQLVDQTVATYCAALVAERNVSIAEDNLASQRLHLQDSRVARKAGTVADFDVLRSEAAVSQAERDLLAALNGRQQSRAALMTLLGERVSTTVELMALALPGKPPEDVEKELDEALARRPDLRAVEQAVLAAEAQVGLAETQDAPTLVLQSGVTPRNPVGLTPGFQWLTSLALNIPLFDGGNAGAQADAARAAVLSLRAQLENAKRNVRLDIFNTWLDLKTRWDTIEVSRRNVDQAAEAFRIAILRYRFGLGTNVELLDARSALTSAQTAEAQAYYSYITSWGHYQRIIGKPWPAVKASGGG